MSLKIIIIFIIISLSLEFILFEHYVNNLLLFLNNTTTELSKINYLNDYDGYFNGTLYIKN